MKKAFLLPLFLSALEPNAQTIFWTETFNNGCAANCLAGGVNTGNGAWSTASNGTNGPTPNIWYISCAENGMPVGTCGASCGSNATLHLGAVGNSDCGCLVCPGGDCGAAYDACNGATFCGGSPQTNQRAISPLISTVGKSGISVSFDYIENGQGAIDDGLAYYSTNGGATWVLLVNTAKTATGCGGQGIWANYTSATLPAAADNNANFRLSFVWINNADGLGNDPSYAINDLKVRYAAVLPIDLINFSAVQSGGPVLLQWSTLMEKNSDHFDVERSEDAVSFSTIGAVGASGNSYTRKDYQFYDTRPIDGLGYYRLKMIDADGAYKFSELLAVNISDLLTASDYFVNAAGRLEIKREFVAANNFDTITIMSSNGEITGSYNISDLSPDNNIAIPLGNLTPGIYLCRMLGNGGQKTFKFLVYH